MKILHYVLILILAGNCNGKSSTENTEKENPVVLEKVLVFTKTEGFRHKSIEKGVELLKSQGNENDFEVTHTEDASVFNNDNLKDYKLVVFLSTTGDILNEGQQEAFKTFINNGGGFVGIHAATDTEYDWPWYGQLVGGYFESHPQTQEAIINLVKGDHPSTQHLSDTWTRTDEWYNFKNLNQNTTTLLNLDESSYEGGKNGENHPIAWFHEFDGGRVFYTGLGHTKESYDEDDFKKHLLGGIFYALGR